MAFSGPGSLSSILVKVNDSSSGLVHTIDSLTVDADASQLKSELFRLTSVPPDKQILLVGPPFSKLKSNAILIETVRPLYG